MADNMVKHNIISKKTLIKYAKPTLDQTFCFSFNVSFFYGFTFKSFEWVLTS